MVAILDFGPKKHKVRYTLCLADIRKNLAYLLNFLKNKTNLTPGGGGGLLVAYGLLAFKTIF